MADLTCAALPDRALLSLGGDEAAGFLDALVSNSVTGLERGQAAYAALLSPQGKFLHDFFVTPDPNTSGLLLDVAAERLPDLQRRLTLYRLRAKVTIAPVDGVRCYALFGGAAPSAVGIQFADPRLPAMGWRLWLPDQADPPLPPADPAVYHAHRIALGVPDGVRDIEIDKGLLLENHFEALHGVDFKKGCYIGQELTARTKYRGLVKKQLCRVQATQPLPPPGTPITANGQEVGQLRSSSGSIGLALLRLDATAQELDVAGIALQAARPDYAGPIPEAKT
ncbi:folate-binding protein [Ferrovibrio terrae]|uniref:CAF17-like 4Fe-4S cluster assembly/insertion protein YgfZ n=1 Tax=Ferrovibrio terrae TaxID=2594003 RepID=UPI003137F8A6